MAEDCLLVVKVTEAEKEYERSFTRTAGSIAIGRSEDSDIVIAGSTSITRNHATISQDIEGTIHLGLGASLRDTTIYIDGDLIEISSNQTVQIAPGQIVQLANDVKISVRKISTPKRVEMKKMAMEELGIYLECSVCYDLLADPLVAIPCMHKFCATCIDRWKVEQNTCPKCRGDLQDCAVDHDLRGCVEIIQQAIGTMALEESKDFTRKRSSVFSCDFPKKRSIGLNLVLSFVFILFSYLFITFVQSHYIISSAGVVGYVFLKL